MGSDDISMMALGLRGSCAGKERERGKTERERGREKERERMRYREREKKGGKRER